MSNPFDINREFEAAIGLYTGSPYVVAVNSCTSALFLALKWHEMNKFGRDDFEEIYDWPVTVTIPKRTYVSVPMQIKLAGLRLAFEDKEWSGMYPLKPFRIWDSARWFTAGLFHKACTTGGGHPHNYVCVSFHSTKTLGIKRRWGDEYREGWDIEQGGAILHNDAAADKWFRRARFDGRTEGVPAAEDTFDMLGYHCYMNPSTARLGLQLLRRLPKDNPPLPNDPYPDLSKAPIFKYA
jgi:dTDP-4-amino-4,6-dideoxygalactose transaminase